MSIPDVQTSGEKEDYQANDGVTAIYGSDDAKKPGQAYSMIKIAASKVVVKGGALQVSVWIQPASSGVLLMMQSISEIEMMRQKNRSF